ncbi:RNA polymerase sigma factor [Patescibacteria group bacterium]|nr:RNA polymerase sigma factor [Patescibacteria group bacterium]
MDLKAEKALVAEAQKNPAVFGRFFDEYHPRIFNYVLKRTANIEIARDIAAETFFKALNKLWQFRWRDIAFSAWLYKIATNEINYYFRKKRYNSVSLDRMLQESGFEPADQADLAAELMEVEKNLEQHRDFLEIQKRLSQLSIRYQEVITLRFFENKKISEISAILGKKEGTIKSLLWRGLEQLKKQLKKEEIKSPAAQLFEKTDIVKDEVQTE